MKLTINSNKHGEITFIIDDEDYDEIKKHKQYISKLKDGGYYVMMWINKKNVFLHRYLMNVFDKNLIIDHINGNPLDNRKCNLRLCDDGQNQRNRKMSINNTSGYKGVIRDRNKWRAQIYIKGRFINLGLFENKIQAAQKYNESAIRYFGEFAKLNVIKNEDIKNNSNWKLDIRKKVLRHERDKSSLHSHGLGFTLLYLECGHIKKQKGNVKIPKHCFCNECMKKSEVLK